MEHVFLIEELWIDSMENTISAAKGYEPIGYIMGEKKAVEFCNKGKTFKQEDCWAIYGTLPQYRFLILKPIKDGEKS